MHILEYCESSGEPVARLAKRMGLDRSHLNKIALGQRDASADLLRRLYEATGGKVTPTDQVFAPRIEPGQQARRVASLRPASVTRSAKALVSTKASAGSPGKMGQSLPSKASAPAKVRRTAKPRPSPKGRAARSEISTG